MLKGQLLLLLLLGLASSVRPLNAAQTNLLQVQGAIARWTFDEGSGTTALDSSSNNNNATILGATYVPGQSGTALSFSGLNQCVFSSDAQSGGVAGAGLDMGLRDWTVSAWVKSTASGMLVTKMGYMGSGPDGWGVSVSGNGTVGLAIRKAGVGEVNLFNGDGKTVLDGQWHHLAVVFNRAGNATRYVDASLTGTQYSLSSLSGQSIDNTNQLRIGARDQLGHEIFFNGLIDEVSIYPRVLTPQEIATLAGLSEPPKPPPWFAPVMLVSTHGRLAVGNRVHVVGHSDGNLVHRSSQDNGANWSAPSIIAPASANYPMQYGGLFAAADTVYLLTAAGDMGATSQPLDFRKSTNNGATWSNPIRITLPGQEIRRANIAASGENVHVFGGQSGAGGYGTGVYYFRSTNGGARWEPGLLLHANADASARMAVDGDTVHVAFGAKLSTNSFGGRTFYMRSTNNGASWTEPVFIGEISATSDVQARQQIAAADGHLLVMWQRERPFTGGPLPADRLGYNRSVDGGVTWLGHTLLPDETGTNRDHHQIWMLPGGGLHVAWCHGSPDDPLSPTGYKFSPDYGASWGPTEIALSTLNEGNLPHGIVADAKWVHIIAEPGAGTYARRPALPPKFTSIRRDGQTVFLEWNGQGIVQSADEVTGPWNDIPDAKSPESLTSSSIRSFYRISVP